jgi:hypothetical protein
LRAVPNEKEGFISVNGEKKHCCLEEREELRL